MSHGAATTSRRRLAARRVLVIQPCLTAVGGGNGVAAWIIAALRHEHRVTLLSWQRPDLEAINRIFGTDLAAGEFEWRPGPALLWRLLSAPPLPLALLKDSLLVQHARRRAGEYDVLISASGEHDLGGQGIQYVHYPRFIPFEPPEHPPLHHRSLPVWLYRSAALRLSGTRVARVRANRTLANSEWVAQLYRRTHGGAAVEVLHPPAAGPFAQVPWDARADGIVCIGRFSPEKRLEMVIDVVERVRARGHGLTLHLAGMVDDPRYADHVRHVAAARSDWVVVHDRLPRAALGALIAQQRYGIHGMPAEHFGMAVAELVAGGCIPFVPDDGGQREIVGNDPRLLFHTAAEGAEKIATVMGDPALQQSLRAALEPRRRAAGPEHFMRRMREVVAEVARPPS
ncbi:MAG TPA: glycosyltransferase family 4 protein [Candidatus Dormibacteraeota bacterium]|nr:glycosyltransferase family 4 protein [Candidatus Dormibacteraeota bacterium]